MSGGLSNVSILEEINLVGTDHNAIIYPFSCSNLTGSGSSDLFLFGFRSDDDLLQWILANTTSVNDTPMGQEHMLCVQDVWDAMDYAVSIIPITPPAK